MGTPQIVSYTYTYPKDNATFTGYYAYMWGTSLEGEGIYTSYPFEANHTYDVKIYINTYGGGGTVYVYAANSLTTPNTAPCGSPLPTEDAQLIGSYTGSTPTTTPPQSTPVPFSFVPNKNYSQLWIYPQGTAQITSDQYNMQLLMVQVCPSCTYDLVLNTGTIPTGTSSAGTIQAGSSAGTGGSGTVINASGQPTTLTASTEIDLLQNLQITYTGGGSFVAQIAPCQITTTQSFLDTVTISAPPPPEPEADNFGSKIMTGTSSSAFQPDTSSAAGLRVVPTVGPGDFTITGGASDLSNAAILVMDASGRPVYRMYNSGNNTIISLNLGTQKNGLYFVQINNGIRVTTTKIIISR
jgi:Secretion system C-terminal sorting domain